MKTNRRSLIIVIVIIVLFLGNYAWAWFDSYRLSKTYYRQAEASYQAGRNVDSLKGYKEYDAAQEKRVFVGGYGQVVGIWDSDWAFPRPAVERQARAKVDAVIQGLCREDAEMYFQTYVGRDDPYLGEVMLRLGQIYEEEGDERGALEMYHLIIDSFRANPPLVERAKEHAIALEGDTD